MNLSFERVAALWGLLLLPAMVILYAIDGQSRRRTLERLGHLPQIRRMIASLSPGARRFKAVLTVTAIACGVVALAGPEVPGRAHIAPRRGLDIVVALDFSKSMLASDVYPTRMERAKAELGRLLDGLKGDRVGLVAFSGVTLSYPLTDDYAAAKLFWRDLSPADIPVGGSDLGLAVREALSLLESGRRVQSSEGKRSPRRPAQVVILLSDGDDTEGTALAAAREAATRGVKILAVGIGSPRGELVKLAARPDGTAEYLMDPSGKPVRMVLDATTLQQVASLTGGDYFEVDGVQPGMERVARAIADLERVEEEARVVKEPEEIAWPFLLAAVLLLVLEACIRERRRVREVRQVRQAEGGGTEGGVVGAGAQGVAGGARLVALLLAALLPALSGFSFFERPSPDVEEGNRQLLRGNAQAALLAYERALGAYPDDVRIHYNRGAALLALGRMPEAEREFLLGAQSPEGTLRADSFYNLGNALLQQSRLQEAIDAYKRSLVLRPGDRHAKWNLELALRKLREQEEQKKQKEEQKKQEQQAQSGQQQDPSQKQQQDPSQKQQDASQQERDPSQQQQDSSQQQQDPSAQTSPAGAGPDAGTGMNRPENQQQQQNQQQAQQQQAQQQQAQQQQQNPSPEQRNANGRPEASPPPSSASPGTAGQGQGQPGQTATPRAPGAGPPRDTERQDAEAVLDAFEAVEPTVQKDLARRRAGNRRPRKDW